MDRPYYDSGWIERDDLPCRICQQPLQKRVMYFYNSTGIRILYRHGGEGEAVMEYMSRVALANPGERSQFREFEARAHGVDVASVPLYRNGSPLLDSKATCP